MQFRSTAQLVSDPALAALVDELARCPRIESPYVGEGGEPSSVFATFRRVAAAASRQQALALLPHHNPVVRSYLHHARDRESLPLFHRSLGSNHIGERRAAAE